MVSSTLSLSAGSLMLALLSSPVAATSYSLVETWQGNNFLDYFNFHVGSDPTNGFVNYLDKETAESSGLVKVTDTGSVYLGVDHATKLNPNGNTGRDSVRIGSKKYYDQSLVIADIAHMPGSVCGTWPAFWSVGKNWPADGEIDIIEGVNLQDYNEIVMHTAGTCSLTDTDMTGSVNATGCGEDIGTIGCKVEGQEGSYGTSFNKQNGGVYSLQWTDDFLKIWYFPRSSIPASITSGNPDVTEFGTPMAVVQESCDVANSFKAQSFVFDVTFCGDWAGGVFGSSGCPVTDSDSFQSCHNYVANNPAKFKETYWEINSVKIYQTGVASISSSESASATTAATSVVSQTTTETHTTHSATTVHSVASKETQTAGAVQELTSTSVPTVAATTESIATEAVAQPSTSTTSTSTTTSIASKKTRTITSIVTATATFCPEAEESSSIAAQSSVATTVSAPAVQSVQIPATAQATEARTSAAAVVPPSSVAYVPTAQSHTNSKPAAVPVAATSVATLPTETFGGSWASSTISSAVPSLVPSAIVSSVPYEASKASKAQSSATTAASPETTTSATTGYYVPTGSESGASPVFTGAGYQLSMSIPALFVGLIVAFLA
ncbi:CAZyme family GH16 [Penicillium roqueforti]|uniref:endo-1,3(4)-beta-glucanase n=1 Tax=Penicillium roqueforti (strain FM164) TaxID=1365484 RepID=W6QJF0_PENRF|nr:CAZyme family GH16 [Penicillium roqueforti]CDM34319.1 Concanavalin A-like lectin/glucanase [Penicillium roqueforti FM164]KAF9238871.1 CAZyme family GH16 [Penicillium roqueforti]KAI1838159.1 CAZyme family GH16 [Penicillium roqueforti]KAI2692561.1 CAZyme family GH16 [Penicillium roqueforti]KAI2705502.1 CAZyme family GH16 [Penicillium roqueforti]